MHLQFCWLCGFLTVLNGRKSQSIAWNCLLRTFFILWSIDQYHRLRICSATTHYHIGTLQAVKTMCVLICAPLPASTFTRTLNINDAETSKTQTVCREKEFKSMLGSYLLHSLTEGGCVAFAQR